MKRIILLSSMLLLSAVWAAAQYESDSGSENRTVSRKMTIEGCLDGAIGSYTLTDQQGASYQLTGKTEQLKDYVGGTMRLTGVVTPVVNMPGAISEGTQTQPTMSVISIQRLSAVCNDENY